MLRPSIPLIRPIRITATATRITTTVTLVIHILIRTGIAPGTPGLIILLFTTVITATDIGVGIGGADSTVLTMDEALPFDPALLLMRVAHGAPRGEDSDSTDKAWQPVIPLDRQAVIPVDSRVVMAVDSQADTPVDLGVAMAGLAAATAGDTVNIAYFNWLCLAGL